MGFPLPGAPSPPAQGGGVGGGGMGSNIMSQHPRPTFTWLGHATVRCDLPGGVVVLIDPWVTQNPSCPKEHKSFDRLDAMLITHAHFDHMGDAVELAKKHKPGK